MMNSEAVETALLKYLEDLLSPVLCGCEFGVQQLSD